jgi:hypothetical protein
VGVKKCSLHHRIETASEALPPSYQVQFVGGPSNAKIKKKKTLKVLFKARYLFISIHTVSTGIILP